MSFAATWMDPEIIILSEVRERQITYDTTYMWNLKYDINGLVYKTDPEKINLRLPKGEGSEGEIS